MEHPGDIAREYDHLRHVNLSILDNLKVTVLTPLTWSHQSKWNKDHRQHQAQVFSNLVGLLLDLIQYWMTAKHNLQCQLLFCFAAIASNKTMTLTKKFLIVGKQRQYHWNTKRSQAIHKPCWPARYLKRNAWDKQMDVIKQDFSEKTPAVYQTTGHNSHSSKYSCQQTTEETWTVKEIQWGHSSRPGKRLHCENTFHQQNYTGLCMPHYGFVNPNKPDKLQRISNAKAPQSGVSLSDKLLAWLDLLENMPGISLRFPRGAIAIQADIEAMLMRIGVRQQDRRYWQFMYRQLNSPELEV